MDSLLKLDGVSKEYKSAYGRVRALCESSLEIERGEILGLVGESGSGKSTMANIIVRLISPDKGKIVFNGVEISSLSARAFRKFRREIQMVFQDPGTTLNGRMKARDIILEGARYNNIVSGSEDGYLSSLLDSVSLRIEDMDKRPEEFSGGEKARIAIARALAMKPEVLICDEITSSLDASLRSGILTLLDSIDSSLIVISHDTLALEYISDRILYMEGGRLGDSNSR